MNANKPSSGTLYRLAWTIAAVACAFSLLAGILVVANLLSTRCASPLDTPEIDALRASLRANPADEGIQARIRDLDWSTRDHYFRGLVSHRTGVLLLLGGLGVALASLRVVSRLGRRVVDPRTLPPDLDALQAESLARWTVAGVMVAVVATGTCLRVVESGSSRVPSAVKGQAATPVPPVHGPLWPSFRGGDGSGAALSSFAPVVWDGASGTGILWKVPVPLPGSSSPVVGGNRVFLTGATDARRDVYCISLESGELLWRAEVKSAAAPAKAVPGIFSDTGYAAPTPVTDGLNVYALFVNGDMIGLDHCSKVLWTADLGLPVNRYGHSSSLAWHQGRVLVQYDQEAGKATPSRLMALDPATGKTVWSTARPVSDSWPSPVVVDTGAGFQVVTVANDWIIAYDPASGEELWKVACSGSDVAPSPILAGRLILVSITGDKIYAIRTDGRGDVSGTHVAWTSEEGVCDVPSPVSDGTLAFFVNSSGLLTCLEVESGRKLWEQALEGEFYGSPGIAAGRLYLVARNGTVFIVKAGRQYEEIGRASLGEPSDGSPVFAGDRMLIRGIRNLFCIGGGVR